MLFLEASIYIRNSSIEGISINELYNWFPRLLTFINKNRNYLTRVENILVSGCINKNPGLKCDHFKH